MNKARIEQLWGELRLRLNREPNAFQVEVELLEMIELLEALLDEEVTPTEPDCWPCMCGLQPTQHIHKGASRVMFKDPQLPEHIAYLPFQ